MARLVVSRCDSPNALTFDELFDVGELQELCFRSYLLCAEVPDRIGQKQEDIQQVENLTALFLKFVIKSGRDDFAAVYLVEVF